MVSMTFFLTAALTAVTAAPTNGARDSGASYSVTMVNNCDETVWPAGYQTNTARGLLDAQYKGFVLAAGKSWTAHVPKDAYGIQFWARQGCTGSESDDSFSCTVGDCSGYRCTDLNWRGGVIQAEFGSGQDTTRYNTAITAYDISAIGGNNVGMKIVPSLDSCLTKECPVEGCAKDQAWGSASQAQEGSPADTTCPNTADYTVTFCPS